LIRSAWFAVVTVFATAWYSIRAIVGGMRKAPHGEFDAVQRGWTRALLGASGVRVQVEGMENLPDDGGAILVANHQSNFDIFALLFALPVSIRFVAKQELSRIPLLAQAMRSAGHVFIDRTDRRGSVRAMRAAAARMRDEGLFLGLFPEGTRSRDGRLGTFKKGSFVLAIETGLPIVPIALDGGWRLAEGRGIRSGEVRIRVGTPIPTEGRTVAERDQVLTEVRRSVAGLLRSLRDESGDTTPV
jgi:1-acyl-sn-glycerol-3-phosphate acyltransferase